MAEMEFGGLEVPDLTVGLPTLRKKSAGNIKAQGLSPAPIGGSQTASLIGNSLTASSDKNTIISITAPSPSRRPQDVSISIQVDNSDNAKSSKTQINNRMGSRDGIAKESLDVINSDGKPFQRNSISKGSSNLLAPASASSHAHLARKGSFSGIDSFDASGNGVKKGLLIAPQLLSPGSGGGGGRRGSFAPGRRGSIQVGNFGNRPLFDEEALKVFFSLKGVTTDDIDTAFEMLSQDKEKITHADIKLFISTYFDWFPEEAMTVLNSWKEEVTKAQMVEILTNKNLMTSPYESAFKWFGPDNGHLGKTQLKKIAKSMAYKKMLNKTDVKHILSKYDYDRDNVIGLDDFKRMGLY